MSGTTSLLGLPYPGLTDPPTVPSDIQALATAVDTTIPAAIGTAVNPMPKGDSSNSVVLGSDVNCGASSTHTLCTTTFTLVTDQWVIVAAKARFDNQTSNASGDVGLRVEVDGSTPSLATSGPIHCGAQGTINERITLGIPPFSVFLAAGSHTIRSRADRDATIATHAAQSSGSINSVNYNPTTLTVIV